MKTRHTNDLLGQDDPPPIRETGERLARVPFLLVGDHAGAAIPRNLSGLGLSSEERSRHIALDIGTEALGGLLSRRLKAPFLWQPYSRLVIDCNRDPRHSDSIKTVSDGTVVPGNENLRETDRQARAAAIHSPYHGAIHETLTARDETQTNSILVSLHSFTPELDGHKRPWEVGVLHDGHEDAFALRVLELLRKQARLTVGDNEPYKMDATDYTVPRHAYPRGLSYVELEVRQDVLERTGGIEAMADLLADVLSRAASER